jgi:hypothetical protein
LKEFRDLRFTNEDLRNLRALRATPSPRQLGPASRWAMIVLSSPATLTGAQEKETGPSRFIADF